ncbi:MAG: hypothetical protein ACJ0SL_06500 [Candidatus Rariloculaceae bacterium]
MIVIFSRSIPSAKVEISRSSPVTSGGFGDSYSSGLAASVDSAVEDDGKAVFQRLNV